MNNAESCGRKACLECETGGGDQHSEVASPLIALCGGGFGYEFYTCS